MARPKEKVILSEAFEQKSQREKEKLKCQLAATLKDDVIRLLTEEIHTDVCITDGHRSIEAHRFILSARASSIFGDFKENDRVGTNFTIPKNDSFDLKDFIRQLYYSENVQALLEENSCYFHKTSNTKHISSEKKENQKKNGDQICDEMLNGLDKHSLCVQTEESPHKYYKQNSSEGEVTLGDVNVQLEHVANTREQTEIPECDSISEKENCLPLTNGAGENLSNLIKLSYSLTLPHECCSELGEDMLRAFLQEKHCDCSLIVAGQQFKAHRCLLASRCEYFEAMLGGQWRESDKEDIELEGVNPGAVEQALLYLYGGVIDVIETCNIPDLLLLGDMYGMAGLKDVAAFQLKKDFCHFFHKPCPVCLPLAGDALTLAVTYNLDDIKDRCVKWINKYFTKFWSSKSFAGQHEDILQLCCTNLISQISEKNVVDIIMDAHKLSGNIPSVKWAGPLQSLLLQLNSAIISYIAQSFIKVLNSKQFLYWEKGAAWNASVLEDIFGSVIESMTPSNGCKMYQALLKLDQYYDKLEYSIDREDIAAFIKVLIKKCETFLRINIHQVTLTDTWSQLPEDIVTKILSCASYVCIDTSKKTRKQPPKLPSSRKDTKKKDSQKTPVLKRQTSNSQTPSTLPSVSGPKTKSVKSKMSAQSTKSPNEKEKIPKVSTMTEDTKELKVKTEEAQTSATLNIYRRQQSDSPESDFLSLSPGSSPRPESKIPIFSQSNLSPRQSRSRSRSPDRSRNIQDGRQGDSNPVNVFFPSTSLLADSQAMKEEDQRKEENSVSKDDENLDSKQIEIRYSKNNDSQTSTYDKSEIVEVLVSDKSKENMQIEQVAAASSEYFSRISSDKIESPSSDDRMNSDSDVSMINQKPFRDQNSVLDTKENRLLPLFKVDFHQPEYS